MNGTVPAPGFARRSDAARQISDLVRSDILSGNLVGALPLEFQLVRRYGGTRNAIRDALSQLRDQGFLSRVPGSGTFVVSEGVVFLLGRSRETIRIVEPLNRPVDEIEDYTLLSVQFREAPEVVARNLRLEPGAAVAYIENLVAVGTTPLRLRASWIPVERCRPMFDGRSLAHFTPKLIEEALGHPVQSDRLLIEAINADEWTAELLQVRPDAALLVLERVMTLPDGVPVEFGFSRHRGDRTILDSSTRAQ